MPAGDVETFHENGKWRNRIETESVLSGEWETKEPAVAAGRDEARARRVEHIIRNLDGTIGERDTYGHDPRDIPAEDSPRAASCGREPAGPARSESRSTARLERLLKVPPLR